MRNATEVPRHSFCVFVLTSEKDSNTLSVDAYFFENGEKILRFQNYPDRRGSNLVLRFSLLPVAPWGRVGENPGNEVGVEKSQGPKGLLTWREEDPSSRKIREGATFR